MARVEPKNTLANLIDVGADDNELAASLRDANKIVVLTQAQYDALSTKDSNTIYIVTS